FSASDRDPAPTQTPIAALSRCGMSCVTMRRPEGRVETRTDFGSGFILHRSCIGEEEFLEPVLIIGDDSERLLAVREVSETVRESRGEARHRFDRRRELGRMRGRERDHRYAGGAVALCDGKGDRGMR